MAWLLVGFIIGMVIVAILASAGLWRSTLLALGLLAIFELFGYILLSKGSVALGFSLWGTFIIVPLILGLLRKIRFHWVIVWELVMFIPILILFLLTRRYKGLKQIR